MMQTNVMTGKEYPKYLRYNKNGKSFVAKKYSFKLPSKKLLEDYEKKKKMFTTQLNKEIMQKLEEKEVNVGKPIDQRKPLTVLQQEILECWKIGMKQKDIVIKLNRKQSIISDSEKLMRNKGYNRGTC